VPVNAGAATWVNVEHLQRTSARVNDTEAPRKASAWLGYHCGRAGEGSAVAAVEQEGEAVQFVA
jgi:hypothetical protein